MKKVAGFTIIEVIIASTLLLSALGVAVSLISSSSLQITNNKKRITAVYLMQECLELTRNVRDSAFGQNVWHCPFFAEDEVENGLEKTFTYAIENGESVQSGANVDCQQDYGVILSPLLTEDSPEEITVGNSSFLRTLTVQDIQTSLEKEVSGAEVYKANAFTATCDVKWTFKGEEYGVSGSEVLSNWKKL